MTSCIISSLMVSGMRRHWSRSCWFRPIVSSAAVMRCWSSTTAMPKKGDRSVGVAPQYASSLGKTANCQTLVSLTLARGEVPVMVALRLFVPESWTSNPARLKRAGVPAEHRAARTKPAIALAEIDRVIAAGVRFGCVLADAGYGLSAPFRQGLTTRGLAWAVGIPRHQKVYPRRGATDLANGQGDRGQSRRADQITLLQNRSCPYKPK